MRVVYVLAVILCAILTPACSRAEATAAADSGGYNLPGKSAAAPAATEPVSPMEDIASADAVRKVLGDPPPAMTLFIESRAFAVRCFDGLPMRWLSRPGAERASFTAHAQPGEYFPFQIAVCAGNKALGPLSLSTRGLNNGNRAIDPSRFHFISLGGIGNDGQPFSKSVSVPAGHVEPVWIAIDVPKDAKGRYQGTITVNAGDGISADAAVALDVSGDVLADGGTSDPARLARLKWLDSTVGSEPTVTRPFIPMSVHGDLLSVLGRDVRLGNDGLPAQIVSHFSGSNTHLVEPGLEMLAAPASFIVDIGNGPIVWKSTPGARSASDVAVNWMTHNASADVDCEVVGKMEFDGSMTIDAQLTARSAIECKEIQFALPLHADAAKYLMGLGNKGGFRPAEVKWKWNADRFQDAVWIGDVNAGVMCRFKGENYRRPLVNIYYPFSPLRLPESWGTGGIDVVPQGTDRVVVRAYTGPRHLAAGQTLHFKIDFFLTPFKLLNTDQHWAERFIHPFEGSGQKVVDHVLTELKPAGPNIVEIHHATYTNPYINYPYNSDSLAALEKFIAAVHQLKSRLMVYYTTRELTINLPELWALRSLAGEVIFPGPGPDARTVVNPKGPDKWLTQHLRDSFIPAWRAHIGSPYNKPDLAVITTPDSRWNNFYLEGLKFLCDRAHIDGVYIDDTALDHRSMQRARRILDTAPGRLVDVHSWNHNNIKAHNSNSAIVYMELFPYIDRLWLGEGFDCNKVSPDYWLIEMSGIPYGLNADMLQNGGNPWLGMLYGETAKLGWIKGDPRPMWKFWDEFQMAGSDMIGYWDWACPVHTNDPNVFATVYQRPDRMLIALGNFSEKPATVRLEIDGAALHLPPGKLQLTAPAIDKMQTAATYGLDEDLKIEGKRGLLLVLTAVK